MKLNHDKCHLLVSGHIQELLGQKYVKRRSAKVVNKNYLLLLLIKI